MAMVFEISALCQQNELFLWQSTYNFKEKLFLKSWGESSFIILFHLYIFKDIIEAKFK